MFPWRKLDPVAAIIFLFAIGVVTTATAQMLT